MQFPDDRQYHADHLWAQQRPEGVWRIGITDYAQEQLGGVIFVDLPEAGSAFAQGASCASIESVKVTSDALMPVSGEVTAREPRPGRRAGAVQHGPLRRGLAGGSPPHGSRGGRRVDGSGLRRPGTGLIF